MYKLITENSFIKAFKDMDRKENFSRAGLIALFEYFESIEDSEFDKIGIELDVIALCCEFTEYSNTVEASQDYGFVSDTEDEEDFDVEAKEWLQDRTTLIEFDGGIIIANF